MKEAHTTYIKKAAWKHERLTFRPIPNWKVTTLSPHSRFFSGLLERVSFHETHLLSVFFDVDSDRDGNIPIPQRYVTQLLLKASRKDYPFGTAAEMGENEVRAERQKFCLYISPHSRRDHGAGALISLQNRSVSIRFLPPSHGLWGSIFSRSFSLSFSALSILSLGSALCLT